MPTYEDTFVEFAGVGCGLGVAGVGVCLPYRRGTLLSLEGDNTFLDDALSLGVHCRRDVELRLTCVHVED